MYVCMCLQVGGVKAGCFRIGNTGGMMDNVIACKLHRPGWCDLIGQHFVECIQIIVDVLVCMVVLILL